MKKFIVFLIILSVLIIQCSNDTSGEIEKSKIETEIIEDDADNFVYEEVETNIIKTNDTKSKTVYKENKKNEVKAEIKTNEIKATNESKENNKEHLEEEIGDLIMTILDFARMNKINPVNSLIKTNNKFIRRFNYVEEKANEQNKNLEDMTLEEMDLLWNECKINEYKLKEKL